MPRGTARDRQTAGTARLTDPETGAAFAECLRVTRPGGAVLASVMSAIGSMSYFLPSSGSEAARSQSRLKA